MVAGLGLKITVGIIAASLLAAAAAPASTVFAPLALAIFIIAIVWPLQQRLQAWMPKLLALADGGVHAPARLHDPSHLPQGGGTVVEEHQRELAEGAVETPVGERQRLGETSLPVDAGREALGRREHAVISVETRHIAVVARGTHGLPRQHTRSAGRVQHGLTAPDIGGPRHMLRRLTKQRRHEELLIDIRCAAADLPLQCPIHERFSLRFRGRR